LSNNGRQETKELAEVQEVVQLCIKPIGGKLFSIKVRKVFEIMVELMTSSR